MGQRRGGRSARAGGLGVVGLAVLAAGCGGGGGTGTPATTYRLTKLAAFDTSTLRPVVAALRNGTLYGTAQVSAASDLDYVWSLPSGPLSVAKRATFIPNAASAFPPLCVDAEGDIFGAENAASVFEVSAKSTASTPIGQFSGYASNPNVTGLTVDGQGDLIACYDAGEALSNGLFRWLPGHDDWQEFAPLLTPVLGTPPPIGMICADSQGDVYGTVGGTVAGFGAGYVYEAHVEQYGAQILANFDLTPGRTPIGPIAVDNQGDVFGTLAPEPYQGGSVYEVVAGSGVVTDLEDFDGASQGGVSGIVTDRRGDAYGAVAFGGAHGYGEVFEIPAGTQRVVDIYDFDGTTAANPTSVVVDDQGDVFGTAGGRLLPPQPPGVPPPASEGSGIVFELTAGPG